MKTNISNFASRMVLLALALCMTMSFAACGSDDDDDSSGSTNGALIGTWYREESASGKQSAYWEQYTFCSNGTGFFKNSYGTTADFTYNTNYEGVINYDIVWWYANGGYKKDKYVWHYHIEGNYLYLDNKKYTRK